MQLKDANASSEVYTDVRTIDPTICTEEREKRYGWLHS